MHRIYAPSFPDAGGFRLSDDEAAHVARVLRLKSGDSVAVFDGGGREALARIESVTQRGVTLEVVSARRPAAEPRVAITLAQALLKSDKLDRVIRDAVMLGATTIQPFVSRRTDVPLKAVMSGSRRRRWEAAAVSSAAQCGRAVVPQVLETRTFSALIQASNGLRLMFVEPDASDSTVGVASVEAAPPSEAMILIGPEGGWDREEVREAAAAGVSLVSFGSRVLRADAAGAAALAVLRYAWRD